MVTEIIQIHNRLGKKVFLLIFRGGNLINKQKINKNNIKLEEYPNLTKNEQYMFINNYLNRLKGDYCSFIEHYNTKAPQEERYKVILTRELEEWI